jgi:hypothetical protein
LNGDLSSIESPHRTGKIEQSLHVRNTPHSDQRHLVLEDDCPEHLNDLADAEGIAPDEQLVR